nr:MAG TPA: hypothetical protein [Microviridae sp.]
MIRFCSFGLKSALALCRMERSGIRLNPFLVSAVRVYVVLLYYLL